MSGYIRLDNIEITHKVEKQKAVGLLIAIGGLQKSLTSIFLIITLLVSKQLFENEILGSHFLVKKRSNQDKEEADSLCNDEGNQFSGAMGALTESKNARNST